MGAASEFGRTVGAAGHAGLRAWAGGCAAAPAVYVGGGVFHVHIAVGEVEAVLLIDVVFAAEGEPEAVGIGQGAHAGVGAAYGGLVVGDAEAQLQGVGDLVRRTEREFIGVAPLGGEDGLVAAGGCGRILRVGHGFAIAEIQLGTVEAGVACPGGVAIERPARREFVHAVQGEGFGGNDAHVSGFGFGVAVGADGVGKCAAHRGLEGRAHQFPFGIAAQVVADFGAVVCAQTQGVVHVPQPGEVVAEAPIAAFHAGIAVGKAVGTTG